MPRLGNLLNFKLEKREKMNALGLALFIVSLLWVLGVILTPYLVPANTIDFGNDGLVGPREHSGQIDEMDNPIARFFYDMGDINCHQHSNRSYFVNENQMPFCARDLGIFLGITITLGVMLLFKMDTPLLLSFVLLIPIAIDGLTQLFTSYESTNPLRMITGLLAGASAGLALVNIIDELTYTFRARQNMVKANEDHVPGIEAPASEEEQKNDLQPHADNEGVEVPGKKITQEGL